MNLPTTFQALRTWDGSQSRAFEELSYQLLKDQVPEGTRAIRTGNPDGGVEWYAKLSDGTEVGWQAKYIDDIDDLLRGMTTSVESVVRERPSLRKLVFVITWNLNTSTQAGKRTSQRKKYDDKILAWQKSIPGADKIEFDLVQGSDLLDILSQPEHRGRTYFWWDHLVLGNSWLAEKFEVQAAAAGKKYRPDLQVDIPIQDDLLALGFDQGLQEAFSKEVHALQDALKDCILYPAGNKEQISLYRAIMNTAEDLKCTLDDFTFVCGDGPTAINNLLDGLKKCLEAIDEAQAFEVGLESQNQAASPSYIKGSQQGPTDIARGYPIRKLISSIEKVQAWLHSSVGMSYRSSLYFLTGAAGSGKTHLLLDATRRALLSNRPAVFLTGAQFGGGDLWASMADQLGLPPLGSDVILGAMDAAGEASSLLGNRFVISIDALNETTPPGYWRTNLSVLRAAISRYPHIALAVSCRDTYFPVIDDGSESKNYVYRAHPGFADREMEAAHQYFQFYNLELPRIPLLIPEFSVPLFLRMYCESVSDSQDRDLLAGHQGRLQILQRYLKVKIDSVARVLDPTAANAYMVETAKQQVTNVLDALVEKLARDGRESIGVVEFEHLVTRHVNGSLRDATRVIGALEDEGVLSRERIYSGDGKFEDGVRFVFQAFSDFLILKRRLELSNDPLNDPTIIEWIRDECSFGILEAATIALPEIFGRELLHVLEVDTKRQDFPVDEAVRSRYFRTRSMIESLLGTLPYRRSESITQATVDLLNAAQSYVSREEFYRTMFMLAPQPDSRLNGDGLHHYLSRFSMAKRDADFGFATYDAVLDGSTPASRLARWAAAGPYPNYDPKVIELACIPLCWLLSSPNRFMRDWVTKSLVKLLKGHLDVVLTLLDRFWNVNDPYVVQRVVVVAYGALLRSDLSVQRDAQALALRVIELVFTPPVRPDELLLDAARGIARWSVANGLAPEAVLLKTRRPYGIKPPSAPPTEETLRSKYGPDKDKTDAESFSTLWFSLTSMGDFVRYVVEPGLRPFSRYRRDQARPGRDNQEPRIIARRLKEFVKSLTGAQPEQLSSLISDPKELLESRWQFDRMHPEVLLSKDQWELLRSAVVYPKAGDDAYPLSLARRWLFRRTLSLGWTPAIFGVQDWRIRHRESGRRAHKVERWGKKYQWIAYHELFARVADNFLVSTFYANEGAYEGLHELIGDREIDPSLPPIAYSDLVQDGERVTNNQLRPSTNMGIWPPMAIDFGAYKGDIELFVADSNSEPTIEGMTQVVDVEGERWIVLEGSLDQSDPNAVEGWRGLQQKVSVTSWFVHATDAASFCEALSTASDQGLPAIFGRHGHVDCCYLGEVGRSGPKCPSRHETFEITSISECEFLAVPSNERYLWEGSLLDCSINESASAILPSTYVQSSAGLTLSDDGLSWRDKQGNIVFTQYGERERGGEALLMRSSFLRTFLDVNKIELVLSMWYERMHLNSNYDREGEPFVESTLVCRVDKSLTYQAVSIDRKLGRLGEGI